MEFYIHLPGILLAYSVVFMALLTPGPAILAIIGTALERGRQPAYWFASGVVCGSAFWGTAAALGMSVILVTYTHALFIFKIAGGLYLLWLAWKSLKSAVGSQTQGSLVEAKKGNARQMWFSGLLLHLMNPKAIMAWIATIALGVTPTSPVWVSFAIVIGSVFLSFVGHFSYALLFSTNRAANLYMKAKRPIAFLFSALFGFAGLKLLTSRV